MASFTKVEIVGGYRGDTVPVHAYCTLLGSGKQNTSVTLVVSTSDRDELVSFDKRSKAISVHSIKLLSGNDENKGVRLVTKVFAARGHLVLAVAFKRSLVLYSLHRKSGDLVAGLELSQTSLLHEVVGIEVSAEGTTVVLHELNSVAVFRVSTGVDGTLQLTFLDRVLGLTIPLGCIRFSCFSPGLLISIECDSESLVLGKLEITARGIVRKSSLIPVAGSSLRSADISSCDEVVFLLEDDRVLRMSATQKNTRTDVRVVQQALCIAWASSEEAIIVAARGRLGVLRFLLFDTALSFLVEHTVKLPFTTIMIRRFTDDVNKLKHRSEVENHRRREKGLVEVANSGLHLFFCCVSDGGETCIVRVSCKAYARNILESFITRSDFNSGLALIERMHAMQKLIPAFTLFLRLSRANRGHNAHHNSKVSHCCRKACVLALMHHSDYVPKLRLQQEKLLLSCVRRLVSTLLTSDRLPEALMIVARSPLPCEAHDVTSIASIQGKEVVEAQARSIEATALDDEDAQRKTAAFSACNLWLSFMTGAGLKACPNSLRLKGESLKDAFKTAWLQDDRRQTNAEPMEQACFELNKLWVSWRNEETQCCKSAELDESEASSQSSTKFSVNSAYRVGLWLELRGDGSNAQAVYRANGLQRESERLVRATMATDPLSSKDLFPHSGHVIASRRSQTKTL